MSLLTNALVNLKNAQRSKKAFVELKAQNPAILKLLKNLWSEGYLNGVTVNSDTRDVTVFSRYTSKNIPAIRSLKVFRHPIYLTKKSLKTLLNKSECVIVSAGNDFILLKTSKLHERIRAKLLFTIN